MIRKIIKYTLGLPILICKTIKILLRALYGTTISSEYHWDWSLTDLKNLWFD
jgi:hypothetical protein